MDNLYSQTANRLCTDLDFDDITQAFENNAIYVQYQPIVELSNRTKVEQVEALVRLQHSRLGHISPALFISLINKTPLMQKLTKFTIGQVIQHLERWKHLSFDISVSIKIPNYLFLESDFVDWLTKFSDYNRQINLEIKYDTELEDSKDLIEVLGSLNREGWQLVLSQIVDDIPSELLLKKLPLKALKLERQTVSMLSLQPQHRNCGQYLVALANKFNIQAQAVGIETLAELEEITQLGFHAAQGLQIKEPIAADELVSWVEQLSPESISRKVWNRPVIAIFEVDIDYQKIYIDSLSGLFEVYTAQNDNDLLSLVEAHSPEVIIINDDSSSDKTEKLSHLLSKSSQFQNASLLFVSNFDSAQSKLNAFEAGALDILVKPISVSELIAKICKITVIQKERNQLKNNLVEANEFAKLSSSKASTYGGILNFYRSILHCHDEKSLADRLFDYLGQKNLHCSIEFRSENGCLYFDQTNPTCSPAEVNVYEVLKDKARLYRFGQRLMVNYGHTACLIKNMPKDEAESEDTSEYLAILLEGIDIRYQDVIRQRTIQNVLARLRSLTDGLTSVVKKELQDKKELMANLEVEIQMSFHALGLTEEQENHLMSIIESMLGSKEDQEISTLEIVDSIEKIISQLNKVTRTVEKSVDQQQRGSTTNEPELF